MSSDGTRIADFDDVAAWKDSLGKHLWRVLPLSTEMELLSSPLVYDDDAEEIVFAAGGKPAVTGAVVSWLQETRVAGYHGTRLSRSEQELMRAHGLRRLDPDSRTAFLKEILNAHPSWSAVEDVLPSKIDTIGHRNRYGERKGQVHLTLSAQGLISSFNHYLQYGSEFDQMVVEDLLGDSGLDLLARARQPYLIRVSVPGIQALEASDPFSANPGNVSSNGDAPDLVRKFVQAWALATARPSRPVDHGHVDCGMIFWNDIPADWIEDISDVDDATLQREDV